LVRLAFCRQNSKIRGPVGKVRIAHTVGDETERAYRRADALDKRRQLMEAWAKFINGSNVVPLAQRVAR
jgi:hypothetical protein